MAHSTLRTFPLICFRGANFAVKSRLCRWRPNARKAWKYGTFSHLTGQSVTSILPSRCGLRRCSECPYKKDCIKGNHCKTPLEERTKSLQVAKTFLKYRQEDLERILSNDGILFRTNRSIQAEGSFGDIKQDMKFRRYLSKGTTNVLAESVLLAMARNINKLHNKIQKGRTGTHLFPLKSA